MLSHVELITRIASGALLGGAIGLERDLNGHHVGLRTHLIVALSAATFMVLSSHFVYYQQYAAGDFVSVDGSRIAASVVSGIGFLAGGAILRSGLSIRGLTTAAGLWLVTAVGMTAGAGMYVEAAVATLIGLITLTSLRRFEDKNGKKVRRRVTITLGSDARQLTELTDEAKRFGAKVGEVDYEKDATTGNVTLSFEMHVPAEADFLGLAEKFQTREGVKAVKINTYK